MYVMNLNIISSHIAPFHYVDVNMAKWSIGASMLISKVGVLQKHKASQMFGEGVQIWEQAAGWWLSNISVQFLLVRPLWYAVAYRI